MGSVVNRVGRAFVPVAALVASCLVALPVGGAVAAEPRPSPAVQDVGGGIDWGPCDPAGPRLQCARVRVPLDWDRPHGRMISLSVIRHLASKPERRIGSMFINPGGPGESGVELVRDGFADLDAWGGGRFDVVGWDPRGTNASTPVRCFPDEAAEARFWRGARVPTTPAASERYAHRTVALARRCGRISGWLLPHISTADTARDLDHLRGLVGDRKLTYFGMSYGSFLGETYANMFPGRVRAMLLDAVVDPSGWVESAEGRNANTVAPSVDVLDRFLALCEKAGPKRCALAGGRRTAAERVDRLFARVRRAPIPAPHADPPGRLTYGDLLLTTFTPLRDPSQWPQYAEQLAAAVKGDGSALVDAARQVRTPSVLTKASTISDGIQCLDGPARKPISAWPTVIGHLTEVGPLWGPILGWWQWAPCAADWPARSTDRYAGPWNRETKNPILLINNRHDPSTGYRNAQRAERLLGNAVLLTNNGYGHPTFQDPSECIDRWRVRYLVQLNTPPRGTVCRPDRRPFDPDFGQPPTG
jgi:pimeloyl-ACP methyl ester carboxylesterase